MKVWKLAIGMIAISPLFGRAEVPTPPTDDEVAQQNGTNNTVLAAAAAAPADNQQRDGRQPNPGGPGGPDGYRFGGPGWGRFGGWMRVLPQDVWSPAEFEQATPWLKEHSPRRLQVVTSMADERPQRKYRLTGALVHVYKNIQNVQKDEPELAQVMTNRVELEDNVFGLVGQYREAKRANDTAKLTSTQQELRQKVGELVETNIKERKSRIARLERTLAQERNKLVTDEKSKDQLVEKRLHNLIDAPPQNPDELQNQGRSDAPAGETVSAAQQ